ncbi:MAG: 1-acyl-sn-glycerol-3-phosphate acyltransferase [Saprospiraceae bacterium]|nr:1-acyl-sn-glycerol-3-phosphate acyltransferase [Saprospiraceae bacterium]
MMQYFRAYGRLIIFGVTMSLGMGYILLATLVAGKNLRRSMRIRRSWIRFISPVLGLDIIKHSTPPEGAFLFVSNHRSFIDPVVILNFIYALPLAKAEVNSYPLIGFGARLTGILYVIRDSPDSRLDARQSIASTLMEGWSVLIYPEGTTEITARSGHFKKGSFEIASVVNTPVIPVAIEYADPSDHWKEWSMFRQYLYQFGKNKCTCRIEFGDAILSDDAEDMLKKTQTWIDRKLIEFRSEFDRKEEE